MKWILPISLFLEIKVLLLGETGVGKSTFINAFANYLKFPELKHAKQSEPYCAIPSSFMITDAFNENMVVTFCSDENESEDVSAGSTSTKMCRDHVFEIGNISIRFIDTPGIADISGIEQDKANLENIIEAIGAHDYINCICILLKPNISRLNASFRYAVIQLLSQFEKSAANNIIFFYTHSRGSNFGPGDTIVPIKALLSEIEEKINVKIRHDKNVFCLDNETFRYILAVKKNIKFRERDIKAFEDSWIESVEQIKKFLNYIFDGLDGRGLKPYSTRNTISIFEARRMIERLKEPTQQIASDIQMNIGLLKEEEKRMRNYQGDIKKYTIPIIETKTSETPEPHIVCASLKCRKHVKLSSGVTYTHYPQVCFHFNQMNTLTNISQKVLSYTPLWYYNPIFIRFDIFDRFDILDKLEKTGIYIDIFGIFNNYKFCKVCVCSPREHFIVNYKTEIIQRADDSLKKDLDYTKSSEELQKKMVNDLKMRIEDIEHEQNVIIEATAKFACFLHNNAIGTFNDSYEKYIELAIENEESKKSDGYVLNQIERYKQNLKNYREIKMILEKAAIHNKEKIKVSDIFETIKLLYELPINGKQIKNICSIQDRAIRKFSQQFQLTHKIEALNIENSDYTLYSHLVNLT